MSVSLAAFDDPFPGNPGLVRSVRDSLRQMAVDLGNEASQLRSAMNGTPGWTGEAHDAFLRSIGTMPAQLTAAHERYDGAQAALGPYADTLELCQQQSRSLRDQAVTVQRNIDSAANGLREQRTWETAEARRASAARTDPTLGSPIAQSWPGTDHNRLLTNANAEFSSLQQALRNLHERFDAAARSAAAAIGAAAQIDRDAGGLFGWFEHRFEDFRRIGQGALDFVLAHAGTIDAIAGALGTAAGLLALFSFVPAIGAIAGGVAIAALAAGGVASLVNGVLAMQGKESVADWAKKSALFLLPFAAKGVAALSVARAATAEVAAGGATKIAGALASRGEGLLADAKTFARDWQAVGDAVKFEAGSVTNSLLGLAKPLTGLAMKGADDVMLYGTAGLNTATKVVKMSGLAGQALVVNEVVEGAKAVRDGADAVKDVVGKAWSGLTHLGSGH